MELHCATLQASFSFSIRGKTLPRGDASATCSSSSSSVSRITARSFSLGSKGRAGFPSLTWRVRLKKSSSSAVVRGGSEEPSHCSTDTLDSSNTTPDDSVRDVQNAKNDVECLDQHKMTKVCDKLIEVFLIDKPTPTDWRRLIAFSKTWDNIRPHFFRRCQDRAASEDDPGMRHKLLRLGRKLKEIDEDVQRHNELLEAVRAAGPSELGEIISRRRKDFTKEFFVHLHTVAESYYADPAEQNALAKLGNSCLAAVQAYDAATENIEALNAAELKFQDIINSPTLDAACRKIDSLAEKNQLDSALVLMISKAWSAAKESNMMKDEVKDILYHLYVTARGNLQRLMPKEIRILKYLLTIKDPEEKLSALKDAFTPGEEVEGQDVDCLYTTPEKLHTWIRTVLDAYHFSREGTLVKEARDLMNPEVIVKLEELKLLVEKKFM
ncbi:uncharacterized protein At4g37920-like isoform X1 [Cucurbita moschata]|uniref:Uncharacterized protein At4g37920-like isoform X1 n=1 Tax=Cucurbita moschata TaxID=3662 RepID=A0A6J1FGS8_CUCMO|nr:uncharacterized protein At4g37920-like isoform X1 [Cucurbita moschata]